MRVLLLSLSLIVLAGCAGRASKPDEVVREPAKQQPHDLAQLQSALGMDRSPRELGLSEKMFDSCRNHVQGDSGKCGMRYLSVLNFKLTCRDSEGTTQEVVTTTRPLVSDSVQFQLDGQRGVLQSDHEGYVQLRAVTAKPVRGHRLVITVGKQFFGKDIEEVDQLVLPNYWCE